VAGNSARPGTTVASRVLAVLGAFDDDHRAMTLTALAKRADLPIATAVHDRLTAYPAVAEEDLGQIVKQFRASS